MFSKLLAVVALAVAAKAAVRAPPQTQFEADVRAIIDPIVEWNDKLFGITAEDGTHEDEWHDANGKPSGTKERVAEFISQGAELWKNAGPQLAALAKTTPVTDSYDYLQLLRGLFPESFETTWLYRLHAPWSSGLGVSEADARAFGAQIDEAWLSAVLDVETVAPSATHDYEVSYNFFWTPDMLTRYYYPKLAAHVQAVPWEPVVQYCTNSDKRTCNSQITSYAAGVCHSTADLGAVANYIGVDNTGRGFPWTCQAYTDAACTKEVFAPAQPCTLPPPWDVYCRPTSDWNGKFGIPPAAPYSTSENPSGLSAVPVGSFKCA